MTVIQCCDLSLGYEGKCVLSHLELSVQEGDYLAIVGENGAGKSTLLRGILGLIRPTGGHIHFHLPPSQVGYLPQQTPIQRDFPASVTEVVLSGLLAATGFARFYSRADREWAGTPRCPRCGGWAPSLSAGAATGSFPAGSSSGCCWHGPCVPPAACCSWMSPLPGWTPPLRMSCTRSLTV